MRAKSKYGETLPKLLERSPFSRIHEGLSVPLATKLGFGACFLSLAPALLGLSACKPSAKAEALEPVPTVTTVVVAAHDVGLTYAYGGRATAYRQVEVRARVGGILERRNYVEGTRVRAGDVLFQIDRAPYEAAVARAAAQVQQQVAQKEKAERDVRRANTLLTTQAGTVQSRDDALSAVALTTAQLAAAQADLRTQVLNLSYTTVTAPLSGVTSLEAVPEGSLVGTASDNSLLTRITQTDPIYVTFSFSSDDLMQVRELAGLNARLSATVDVGGAALTGVVDFTDSSIDQATGTVRGRALFANVDARLAPGQFVRVLLGGVTLRGATTLPKLAVSQDATGTFAYVVENRRARRAEVALGPSVGDEWVVAGLRPGDVVINDGIVHVREGGEVRVVQEVKPGA